MRQCHMLHMSLFLNFSDHIVKVSNSQNDMLAGLSARHHLMHRALTVSWKRYLGTVSSSHARKV